MANIKFHPWQEAVLKTISEKEKAVVRFIGDMDIMNMYSHTIRPHVITPPTWSLTDYREVDQIHRDEMREAYECDPDLKPWRAPVAVATNTDSRTDRIKEEIMWINENTQQCVQLYHYPFMDRNTFLFFDWSEALAFKLAWVDK